MKISTSLISVREIFTWVSRLPEDVRLVFVGHEVFYVTHLVVHGDQVVHVDLCAHLDPGQ